MATNNESTNSITRELNDAINELHGALQRASGATATIKGLLPRIDAIGGVFDEIEAIIESGRAQLGIGGQRQSPAAWSRPTLVVPGAAAPRAPQPWAPQPAGDPTFETPAGAEPSTAPEEPGAIRDESEQEQEGAAAERAGEQLTTFRLEFESRPGPLDLRAVDDAVSEHPAVRDVALLDYDGRKATLKVWIVASASPAEVQQALTTRAANLFPGGNDVTIVALEDVA